MSPSNITQLDRGAARAGDPVGDGITALERAMRARAEYLSLKAHTETARIEYQAAVTDLRLISRQLGSQVAA